MKTKLAGYPAVMASPEFEARRAIVLGLMILSVAVPMMGQAAQNPSPMVEHTREHPRLTKSSPPGVRRQLKVGSLFIPEKLKGRPEVPLLVFFHGGDWLPEVAAARQKNLAVITVQAGSGSGSYAKLFVEAGSFPGLIADAEASGGVKFSEIDLGGWSAGCGALRQILRDTASYERVSRVLCIDGVHAGYVTGEPGTAIEPKDLDSWQQFGRDAIAGKKRLIITHSEIFPGTYASTTETADYLLGQWGLAARPVVKWGPMRTQMLSEVKAGGLIVVGFAGNSAPDHVDQMQSLGEYLGWLLRR
jgi:hypothetical protein